MHYVYAHTKPSGEIFYIGKGQRKRAYDSGCRNRHWQSITKKYGFIPIILASFDTEQQALTEEALLIAHFKKFGTLVNILDTGMMNPMSHPDVAKQVAATKQAKGQYANNWKSYNQLFQAQMKDPIFAQLTKVKRQKAQQASLVIRRQKSLDKSKIVLSLRQQGLRYIDIQKALNVSVGFISKIVKSQGAHV